MVFESSFASMHNVKGSLWISFWISDPENVKFGYKKEEGKVWSLSFLLGIPIQIHFLGQTVCRGVKGTSIYLNGAQRKPLPHLFLLDTVNKEKVLA